MKQISHRINQKLYKSRIKTNVRVWFKYVFITFIFTIFLMKLGDLSLNSSKALYDIAIDRKGSIYEPFGWMTIKYNNNGSLIANIPTHIANPPFSDNTAIAVDQHGYVYSVNCAIGIQKFNSSGTLIFTFRPNSGFLPLGSSDICPNSGYNIKVDKVGNVYLISPDAPYIRKFNRDGILIVEWGKPITNITKFVPYEFKFPTGLALDNKGNVYVADIGDFRIQKFTSNGTFITGWKTNRYDINNANFFNSDRQEQLQIAVDGDGNVYAADSGTIYSEVEDIRDPSIQKFNNGTLIKEFVPYDKDHNPIIPSGIAVDNEDKLYVSDGFDHRFLKYTNNGTLIEDCPYSPKQKCFYK